MEDQMPAVEVLPVDVLAQCFLLLSSFKDLAQTSRVCRKWREAVRLSIAMRDKLSFAGWKIDDASLSRIIDGAYGLRELDISQSCWGCRITDDGLYNISLSKCCKNLNSISMWGITGITDKGVIQLVSRASSLEHLNIGGTFITDESLFTIARYCTHLKAVILWSCRHVTERGLLALITGCRKLQSINVWGVMASVECLKALLSINPQLLIKPIARFPRWPVVQP